MQIEIAGVVLSDAGIGESSVDGGRPIFLIASLDSCVLRRGRLSASPVLQLGTALLLVFGSALGIVVVYRSVAAGRSLFGKLIAGMISTFLVGLWLAYDWTKVGHYLAIRRGDDVTRVAFSRSLVAADIAAIEDYFRSKAPAKFSREVV